MRIALVTGHAIPVPPRQSGPAAARYPHAQGVGVAALGRALAALDHQVTIYARKDSPARPRTGSAAGVKIEYLPAGPAAPLPEDELVSQLGSFSGELARRWRQTPPDVVHAHFWTSGLAALAASRELPAPVVQTFHTLSARPGSQGQHAARPGTCAARSRLEAVIARSVTAVLAGSCGEMSALARLGVPRTSMRVVPAGVDTEKFGPAGPVARRSKRPRLLAVSALAAEHGLDTVVKALAWVPGAELVIAGGPPRAQLTSDPALRELARLADRLKVRDRLLFAGEVTRARMPALLRSADLFIHVAPDEPDGLVAVEAMACGTPVVASAGCAQQDAIVDGATGALIAPGDPAALARRVRQLLRSPMLLQGYGIAAADRVRTRYSWERIGQDTLAVYEGSRKAGA